MKEGGKEGREVGRLNSLDWTGLTQKSAKCLFQCRTEAKHTYFFTKVACTGFLESVEVKGHVHI